MGIEDHSSILSKAMLPNNGSEAGKVLALCCKPLIYLKEPYLHRSSTIFYVYITNQLDFFGDDALQYPRNYIYIEGYFCWFDPQKSFTDQMKVLCCFKECTYKPRILPSSGNSNTDKMRWLVEVTVIRHDHLDANLFRTFIDLINFEQEFQVAPGLFFLWNLGPKMSKT